MKERPARVSRENVRETHRECERAGHNASIWTTIDEQTYTRYVFYYCAYCSYDIETEVR